VQIAFDFDSVIVDTGLTLCGLITEHLGYVVTPDDIHHYGLERNFDDLDKKSSRYIINKLLETECTLLIPPVDGAFDFLKWYAKDNIIHIISTRKNTESADIYCQHKMDHATYSKTRFYSTKDKGKLCRELGITHFVDDYLNNLINLANNGIVPIMFLRNWNKHILTGRSNLGELIRFVYSWEDMYGIVNCERENVI
jgi:hypothetical protein